MSRLLAILAISSTTEPYSQIKNTYHISINPQYDIHHESQKKKINFENKQKNLIQKKYPTKTFYQKDCISK